jgi:hypothetical protein
MPAKPDESKRLIKFFEFQTDAPLLGEPRNYSHVYRVAVGDRCLAREQKMVDHSPACPAGLGLPCAIVRTCWSSIRSADAHERVGHRADIRHLCPPG